MFSESPSARTFVDPPTNRAAFAPPQPLQQAPAPNEDQAESLLAIADELTELGALDAESKSQLMDDLQAADPKSWPLILKQFRSALAYRKQLAAREETIETDSELPDLELGEQRESLSTLTRPRRSRVREIDHSTDAADSMHSARPPSASNSPSENNSLAAETPRAHENAPQAIVLSKPPQNGALQARRNVRQASYQSSPPLGWQEHLRGAVQDLHASAPPDPASSDEVNQHMRLRLLQLLAGDQEAALQPIPGASAPQQDYWSQQLFAVSTFLDSQSQPDNKRRASGSLTHLDQARAKLAELATLQVRSLTFVESVGGYGEYTLHEEAKFRPGESVTLYAEIENFTSESTKEGHRTRLGTSFEILDQNGKRVDSAQFPEVEDLCKTPRRDFHMQYTITLPTRIYADEYEIRLIVTDEQSQKIGQASLPFEIAE